MTKSIHPSPNPALLVPVQPDNRKGDDEALRNAIINININGTPARQAVVKREAKPKAATRQNPSAQQILSVAGAAILVANAEGKIAQWNHCACLMFGYDDDELLGLSIYELLPPHLRQLHGVLLKRLVADMENDRRISKRNQVSGYRKDGSSFPIEVSIAKFLNSGERVLVITMHDIIAGKKTTQPLLPCPTHDGLTGLPNRELLYEKISTALRCTNRNRLSVALLLIEVDRLKFVNETHGHQAGDMLLKAVASRLIEQVRPGDYVARLAGNSFAVLCEQVEQIEDIEHADQANSMSVLAERISQALRQPFNWNGLPLIVTASTGIAIGNGACSANDLLHHADTARQQATEKGSNRWQLFSEKINQQANRRMAISNGLSGVLERDELSARFQPIVAADTGHIVGAELLLRWHRPDGEVSPAEFITVAEKTGAILPIGAWVFRQACNAEADWRERWGSKAPYVSVNVSVRQLNGMLVDEFAAILRESAADPTRLLLEITETALMTDVEANLRILHGLAKLGLRVAVDDFGAGYSSLAQLTRLPVDVLKIDKAFIDDIEKSPENRMVIRAVIGLGRALGLKLVAEGVETSTQRIELCSLGCDFIQGYYFHRPLDEKAFIETVAREMRDGIPEVATALHYLIYVSQAVQPILDTPLDALLKPARNANRATGITGCLLYQDGYFMQMLEGNRETVFALYEKIKGDPRHRDVSLVMEGPARHRVFMDWSMMLRDNTLHPHNLAFKQWQRRAISFREIAQDARMCYSYITAGIHGTLPVADTCV
jgi:diguanylate cyclase (GGDEF)-like protein/PAS domain S-box-containing protein